MKRVFQHLFCTHRAPRDEITAFKLALVPHPENSDTRKAVTLGLVALWIVMTAGYQFGVEPPPEVYGPLSGFVWWRVGKIQEQEADRADSEKTSK